MVGRAARAAAVAFAAATTFATSAQKNQVPGDDFGHVLLLVGLLVIPGASLQAALDVDLIALLQVFTGDLRQTLPEHDVVPFRAVLPLPGSYL